MRLQAGASASRGVCKPGRLQAAALVLPRRIPDPAPRMTRILPLAAAFLLLAACSDGARPDIAAATAPAKPIKANDWPAAAATAAASGDPLEPRLVAYLHALAPGAAPGEIAAVLHDSPEFPNGAVLRARYAAALAADPDDAEVRALCAADRPVSADGLLRCASLAPNAVDARAAWRGGAPRDEWAEAAFLRRWGSAVTPDDQWARFATFAAMGPRGAEASLRAAARLDPLRRALAEARVTLAAGGAEPLGVFATVPAPLQNDPVLVLAVARALRKGGTNDAALAFWRAHGFAAEAAHPSAAFWTERELLARAVLNAGDTANALALADDAAAAPETAQADALFLAGWIALRQAHRPDIAADRFGRLATISTSLVTRARAAYWLARTSQAAGDAAAARRHATEASAFPTTFYGQRAAALTDGPPLARRLAAAAEPAPGAPAALAFADEEMPRAALLLTAWGEPKRARAFVEAADLAQPTPARHALAARLALSLGLPEEAVTIARRAGRAGIAMPRLGWPRPVVPPAPVVPTAIVPPALLLGLIRQESGFDTGAVSPSGALGLAQLMPATAAELGRGEGLHVSPARLTADPALNMRLGAAYLATLLNRFGGVAPAAIAAYNAGPHRVAGWPEPPAASLDDDRTIDWIETIPVSETRNYVERVLENEAVYAATPPPPASAAEAMLALPPHS